MKCPECTRQAPPNTLYCEYCGAEIKPNQGTRIETVEELTGPPAQGGARPPERKQRTVYEPDPEASAAPNWRGPEKASAASYAHDVFAHPMPPRAPINERDPFHAHQDPATPPPLPPLPPGPPRTSRQGTIMDVVEERAPRIAGVLIEYRHDQDPGRLHAVRLGRNTLGRGDDQDICLEDGRVSHQHAFIFPKGGHATYIDTSTNGSMVDGTLVHGEQVELKSGSEIRLGTLRLHFLLVPPLRPLTGGGE